MKISITREDGWLWVKPNWFNLIISGILGSAVGFSIGQGCLGHGVWWILYALPGIAWLCYIIATIIKLKAIR